MKLNRIRVSVETDKRLRLLKARTGLTPNLLCRLGICLSLSERTPPDSISHLDTDGREFNRYTLTGPWDNLFLALIRQDCFDRGLPLPESLEEQFLAHLYRGVLLLSMRVKSLEDIEHLIQESVNARR